MDLFLILCDEFFYLFNDGRNRVFDDNFSFFPLSSPHEMLVNPRISGCRIKVAIESTLNIITSFRNLSLQFFLRVIPDHVCCFRLCADAPPCELNQEPFSAVRTAVLLQEQVSILKM